MKNKYRNKIKNYLATNNIEGSFIKIKTKRIILIDLVSLNDSNKKWLFRLLDKINGRNK
jgi:hypothetical protein